MPWVDMIKTSNKGNLLFYDVDESVGKNGFNGRADVLLVQFLLKSALRTKLFQRFPNELPMSINGIPDEPTLANILHFQRVTAAQGKMLAYVDGRIDPVPGTGIRSPAGTTYGIIMLNQAFATARPGDLPKLAQLPDCPPELRGQLAVNFIGYWQ